MIDETIISELLDLIKAALADDRPWTWVTAEVKDGKLSVDLHNTIRDKSSVHPRITFEI